MNSKLEPGDLALIIKTTLGKNIGKIVTCLQVISTTNPQYGIIWEVQSSKNDLTDLGGFTSDSVLIPQDWLRKIPKDPLPEDDLNLEINEDQELTV